MKKLFIFLLLILTIPCLSFSHSFIIKGKAEYSYEIKSKNQKLLDDFYEYENESNSQKVIKRENGRIIVKNTANLGFFKSEAPFPVLTAYSSNSKLKENLDLHTTVEGYIIRTINGKKSKEPFVKRSALSKKQIAYLKKIAENLTKDSIYQWQAVEKVISYVRENVNYKLGTSTDPVRVLETKLAYCEGYANVSAMMLQTLGIPSRKVSCYVPAGHTWGLGGRGEGVFHAYVEVYYKDRGWVAYDPQESLHYVTPYHIVNFPREGAEVTEVQDINEQKIIDSEAYPKKWREFFKRQTDEKQNSAIIVAKIINRKKEVVRDSYSTNQWVFIKTLTVRDPGIRILDTGEFAIPVYDINKETAFYYIDSNGAYLEKKVKFNSIERKDFLFDLSDKNKTISLQVIDPAKQLLRWQKNREDKWFIKEYPINQNGMIELLLDPGKYVFSQSTNEGDSRYVLKVPNQAEEPISLKSLAPYFDPKFNFIYGRALDSIGKAFSAKIKIADSEGRFYPAVSVKEDGSFVHFVPDIQFNIVHLEAEGLFAEKKVDFSKEKHIEVLFDLKKDKFTKIETGKPNSIVYFNVKSGRRYTNYVEVKTDSKGTVNVLLPENNYYVAVNNPFKDMKEVKIPSKGSINLK